MKDKERFEKCCYCMFGIYINVSSCAVNKDVEVWDGKCPDWRSNIRPLADVHFPKKKNDETKSQ